MSHRLISVQYLACFEVLSCCWVVRSCTFVILWCYFLFACVYGDLILEFIVCLYDLIPLVRVCTEVILSLIVCMCMCMVTLVFISDRPWSSMVTYWIPFGGFGVYLPGSSRVETTRSRSWDYITAWGVRYYWEIFHFFGCTIRPILAGWPLADRFSCFRVPV